MANGSPVAAKKLFGNRFSTPLDGNARFPDGRVIFGPSKTVRGIVVAIVATGICAPLIGLPLETGLLVGAFAMIGDLSASFIKRRLDLAPSSKAVGLDQIPESLLPLIASSYALPLTAFDITVCTALFFAGELMFSPLLYRLGLRDRPF
jgi:hypothetical protein